MEAFSSPLNLIFLSKADTKETKSREICKKDKPEPENKDRKGKNKTFKFGQQC